MPIWSEILAELIDTQRQDRPTDFDGVRRKYLAELHTHSKRNVILLSQVAFFSYPSDCAATRHVGGYHDSMCR